MVRSPQFVADGRVVQERVHVVEPEEVGDALFGDGVRQVVVVVAGVDQDDRLEERGHHRDDTVGVGVLQDEQDAVGVRAGVDKRNIARFRSALSIAYAMRTSFLPYPSSL